MIVDAATYVTDRMAESAAERAAERIGPKVAWAMAVVMLGIAASVFCLAAGYTYLATIYGSMGGSPSDRDGMCAACTRIADRSVGVSHSVASIAPATC